MSFDSALCVRRDYDGVLAGLQVVSGVLEEAVELFPQEVAAEDRVELDLLVGLQDDAFAPGESRVLDSLAFGVQVCFFFGVFGVCGLVEETHGPADEDVDALRDVSFLEDAFAEGALAVGHLVCEALQRDHFEVCEVGVPAEVVHLVVEVRPADSLEVVREGVVLFDLQRRGVFGALELDACFALLLCVRPAYCS